MFQCSSASRKFLNALVDRAQTLNVVFQCSSASRKFLNGHSRRRSRLSFSVSVLFSEPKIPQCCGIAVTGATHTRFSALQRAENSSIDPNYYDPALAARCFSALQRAENSSIVSGSSRTSVLFAVSVLFSEPKIPQFPRAVRKDQRCVDEVSVLFSEPKIPQSCPIRRALEVVARFSALQRAENSSMRTAVGQLRRPDPGVSVLFSEPKIPQFSVTLWLIV